MNEEILKKLRYKEGRAAVINAPDGYELGTHDREEREGPYDFLQLFVHDAQQVRDWLPKVIPLLAEDAVFWIAYPKQSSKVKTDINRDSLFTLVSDNSPYRAVSNVAIDGTWSALRFRHKDKVKSKN